MFWIVAIAGLGFAAFFFTSSNWSHERKARQVADEAVAALHAVELDDVFDPIEFGSRFGSALAEHTGRNHLSPVRGGDKTNQWNAGFVLSVAE